MEKDPSEIPQQASASPHSACQRLFNHRERIFAIWENRVRKEVPAAALQEHTALRNSIPEYIKEIANCLSNLDNATVRKSNLWNVSKEHGQERANQECYTLSQVLQEYNTLRRVIIDHLKQSGPLSIEEVEIIFDSIQEAMTLAATQFANERSQREKEFSSRLKMEAELRERFVSTLSHDLRNPLSAARVSAQVILRQPNHAETNIRMALRIITNTERIDRMIENLLDVSRIRAGEKLPLKLQETSLSEIAQQAIDEIATTHGDRFQLKTSGNLDGFWCPFGLRRAIENLLTNAVKYGNPHTPITVRLNSASDQARLTVHNFGNPIPPEDQASLFRAYSRSKEADAGSQKGWGLGLTLVKGIVESHGGKIHLESTPGTGTTFTIEIPRYSKEKA